MKEYFLIALLSFLLPNMLWGQMVEDSSLLRVEDRFSTQLEIFPQEKLHLHTDRDFYVPGEKIWFKAYLADAATLQPSTQSRYVYVELIDSRDSLINRVMIRPENNMFYGNLPILENVPEGDYTLRTYTRYMENLGDDYFFKKNIRIGNFSSNKKQLSKTKSGNGKEQTAVDDFGVSFFPEGGNLVEGVACKVAFKALNRSGYSETIVGDIVDEAGSPIASVQTIHAGMGAFRYLPQAGKRYFLKCRNGNGLEKQFELPQADPRAYTMTVSRKNQLLTVNVWKSAQAMDAPRYLLAHCRGRVFYFSAIQGIAGQARNDNEDQGIAGLTRDVIIFPEKDLPGGILQFVLFDEQMNPLSERLVFCKNYDQAKVEFHTDSAVYKPRKLVTSSISLTDSDGNPQTGNLSVAITDDKDVAIDSTTTILTTLLLSSELKGYNENPAYYLQDNPESAVALDYLMLTHGWRRYSIPDVVKGNYTSPQIPFQTSQEISGQVKSINRSKPVSNSQIQVLTMLKDGNFGSAITDKNGAFTYSDFEYPDSTSYYIQALGKNGSNGVELVINKESFPPLIHAPQSPFVETTVNKPDAFMVKAEQRSRYDEDMRTIQLNEVIIKGSRIERKEEPRLQFWANSSSDVTLRRKDVEKWHPRLVADMLRLVAGVSVSPNGIVSIDGGGLPLVMIDGVYLEWPKPLMNPQDSPLEAVSVSEVESIDVFKYGSASVFGVRGFYGAISITTRRGTDVMRDIEKMSESKTFNHAIYTPLGYQKPVEFYSPQYETSDDKNSAIPDYRTTIFWKPDIVVSDTTGASFEFYTSDFPTTYSVVIEGLTNDGKIIRQVEKIRVE